MATAFMTSTLGAGARLIVEIAWGADLAAAEGTWAWTDVTGDVRQANGAKIRMRHGRGDEAGATQPAECVLELDNRAGTYSLGGQSSNWPNVRRGTPVRVRVDPTASGASYTKIFLGFSASWAPRWDVTGRDAVVVLTASGTLRRLMQGSSPVLSSFRRAHIGLASLVAYWPCEEGRGAASFASELSDGADMLISGASVPASSTAFDCSAAMPVLKTGTWRGAIVPYTGTGTVQLRFLVAFTSGSDIVLAIIHTTGSIARVELRLDSAGGGGIGLQGFDTAGNSAFDSGGIIFNQESKVGQLTVQLDDTGVGVDWNINLLILGSFQSSQYSGTAAGESVSRATAVTIAPNGDGGDIAVGHVDVRSVWTGATDLLFQLNANSGENVSTRVARLCAENAVPVVMVGTSDVKMGSQRNGSLLTLLRECEATDQGLLYDGLDAGLTYLARTARENPVASLTLNAATGQLAREVAPVDDDQRNVNTASATRSDGSTVTFVDADGPLGTGAVGTYDDSVTVSPQTDFRLIDYAGALVGRGTVEGYRYPRLSLDLARTPSLAPTWLTVGPSDRIDVSNINSVRGQHPAGTVGLVVEGYSQEIDQFRWDIEVNASPLDPARATVIATETGDVGANVARAVGDGSTLSAAAALGATSLSVATASGPLWTTAADDLPLDIEVGGIRVTVTAISGAASPQTFTVTAATVTKALSTGVAVSLWHPAMMGL